MRCLRICVAVAMLAFMGASSVSACPMCKDAIANADAEDQNANLPRTYNQSIYLMVSVPYLCLGVVGFMVYRGCRQNEAYRLARGTPTSSERNGACPS